MENSLRQVFFKYGLTTEEIEDMASICSGLEIVDTERVVKNLSLLEQFGFPKYDLDSLIIINPTFMLCYLVPTKKRKQKHTALAQNNLNKEPTE